MAGSIHMRARAIYKPIARRSPPPHSSPPGRVAQHKQRAGAEAHPPSRLLVVKKPAPDSSLCEGQRAREAESEGLRPAPSLVGGGLTLLTPESRSPGLVSTARRSHPFLRCHPAARRRRHHAAGNGEVMHEKWP